jgi:hypothetical protein
MNVTWKTSKKLRPTDFAKLTDWEWMRRSFHDAGMDISDYFTPITPVDLQRDVVESGELINHIHTQFLYMFIDDQLIGLYEPMK